tara:strand:- start:263 stop:463 length:201 start_codon:yes stop_codon:yes gene_type:complete
MSKEITTKQFEELITNYTNKICSDIIKNGFKSVEGWVKVIALSEFTIKENPLPYPVELQDINPSTK